MTTQELYCEMEALKCEREAMLALNKYREMRGETIAYDDIPFFELAEKFRELGRQ